MKQRESTGTNSDAGSNAGSRAKPSVGSNAGSRARSKRTRPVHTNSGTQANSRIDAQVSARTGTKARLQRQSHAQRHATPTQRMTRRSAAHVENAHKRRGIFQIIWGVVIMLAIALIAVGGSHVNEHIIQNAAKTAQSTQAIDYNVLNNGYTQLTREGGYYHNPQTGLKETWYSQNVLPGGGLEIEGRHVSDDGLVRDEAGYIVCASSDYEKGSIIQTSLGAAKVYDTGCPNGIVDIYTDW